MGLYDFAQCRPGNDGLHRLQEFIASGRLTVVLERLVGRHGMGLLFHGVNGPLCEEHFVKPSTRHGLAALFRSVPL